MNVSSDSTVTPVARTSGDTLAENGVDLPALPKECWTKICDCLNPRDIHHFKQVCKPFRAVVLEGSIPKICVEKTVKSGMEDAKGVCAKSSVTTVTDISYDLDSNLAKYRQSLLIHACKEGLIDTVKALLAKNRDYPYPKFTYALREAAINGHVAIVQTLLQDQRVDPSNLNCYAIAHILNNGHIAIAQLLVEKVGFYGSSAALRKAAECGNKEIVQALLKKRLHDGNQVNGLFNAVEIAAINGHAQIVAILLQDGRINPANLRNSAIRIASASGDIDVVQILLHDNRINPLDRRFIEGRPLETGTCDALENAAIMGHIAVVRRLLQHDRVRPSINVNYIIQLALRCNATNVIELLINDPNVDDDARFRYDFLHVAKNGEADRIRHLLEDERVDLDLCKIALQIAVRQGQINVVEILLKNPELNPIEVLQGMDRSEAIANLLAAKERLLRRKMYIVTAIAPIFHLVATVVNAAYRILKIISFAHFWLPQYRSYTLKKRVMEMRKDALIIVLQSLFYLGFYVLAIDSIQSPWEGRKGVCNMEEMILGTKWLSRLLT